MAPNLKDYTPALMQGANIDVSVADLTIDDLACDTITATGASSLAAVTASGAVIAQSTLAVTGASTFTGNVDASSATLKHKRNVLASSGNTTMTSAMSGSVMLIDGATTAYTLPAIAAGDVGMEFWFTVTTTSSAATITAGAADLLTGGVMCMSTGAGIENDAFSPDVTDDLIITMNGTTQGGIIGSTWHLIAISASRWYCDGTTIGSGTLITPFS